MTQPSDTTPTEPPPTQRNPTDDHFPTGPEVGDMLPDFTLTDQSGRAVGFHTSRGHRRALVVFHRSARW